MTQNNETVILLHGIGRSRFSMKKMEKVLRKALYHTINCNYPSRRFPIEQLAPQVIKPALQQCQSASQIHFVTHSMGGILLRYFLAKNTIHNLGRIVMLAPPNQGSEVADWLKQYRWFNAYFGPAGRQLGTDTESIPCRLGKIDYPVAVIAGSKAFNILTQHHLPHPNDGTVSVASTKISGMQDHLCLPVTHTFIMNNKTVIEKTLQFLQSGHFNAHNAPDD